jgi:thioredoxin reductase
MTLEHPPLSDLLIIGGGPTGLFATFYAGLRKMSVTLTDSLETLGGQLVTLYPEKYIYDVPGFPKVLAKDLAARLVEQATQYNPHVHLGEEVRDLMQTSDNHFAITTSRGEHRAKAILIAAGIGAFIPKRLSIVDVKKYEGHGLHYFARDLSLFKDQRVLIVGGGDSAVDWANTLSPMAKSVTLIHRRDQFRAHEESVSQMKAGRTRIVPFHELHAIEGAYRVERAIIYDNRSKDQQSIEVDQILVNIGFESSLGPIKNWGLTLEGSAIKVDPMMKTSRDGIFAAGDIVAYPGKLKLIATNFGEACTAVNYVKTYVDPAARAFPGHSTETFKTTKETSK